MNMNPVELERQARQMRAEAVSQWLSHLPGYLRRTARNFAAFVNAFRAFPGVRA